MTCRTQLILLAIVVAVIPIQSLSQSNETAGVRGRVTTYFGDPLEGAEVSFFLLEKQKGDFVVLSNTPTRTVRTDSHGQYKVAGLPAGQYRTTATLLGFPTSEYLRFYLWMGADRILDFGLKLGITHGLELIRISGDVLDEKGKAIVGATVTLVSAFNSTEIRQTVSDKNGRYKLEVIQPGQYVIYAVAPKFLTSSSTFLVDTRSGKKGLHADATRKLNLRLKPLAEK